MKSEKYNRVVVESRMVDSKEKERKEVKRKKRKKEGERKQKKDMDER